MANLQTASLLAEGRCREVSDMIGRVSRPVGGICTQMEPGAEELAVEVHPAADSLHRRLET